VFIAMEYFPLGDLSMYLNSIVVEDEVRTIAKQLTYGLKIMHDYNLVHRDINPKVKCSFSDKTMS
jgi:serine/threonine protein kinase